MKVGYIFTGPRTPSLAAQRTALKAEGVERVFEDTDKARDRRSDMIDVLLEEGDVVVLCKPNLIGSGAEDTAYAVRRIGAKGAAIEVIGCGPHVYTSDTEIRNFAAHALRVSRQANHAIMVQTRNKPGPKGKLDAMSDHDWQTVRYLWGQGVKQVIIVGLCHLWGYPTVTRFDLAKRIAAEMRASDTSPDDT